MSEAERIRQICASKGIRISKLEKDLGFGNGYINPKKVTHFSHERLLKIADYLGVSVGDITGEETTKKPVTIDGNGLTDEEIDVINALRSAPPDVRRHLMAFLKSAGFGHDTQDDPSKR